MSDTEEIDSLAPGTIAEAFYDFEGALHYANAIFGAADMRVFTPDLARCSEALLAFVNDVCQLQQLQRSILDGRNNREATLRDESLRRVHQSTSLRASSPAAYDLLALKEPVSRESLKEARRQATKLHHPDLIGGNGRNMQLINDGFDALWEAVGHIYGQPARQRETIAIRDVSTCFRLVVSALVGIAMDDGDIDGVLKLLPLCVQHDIQGPYEIAEGSSQRFLDLCVLADRKADASQIIKATQLDIAISKKSPRIVIVHQRLAESAFRYGVIDAKSIAHYRARFSAEKETRQYRQAALERYSQERGFVRLTTDGAQIRGNVVGLVPRAGYGQLLDELTPQQQAAYRSIFVEGKVVQNYGDFLGTRLHQVFRAVFDVRESVPFERLAEEAVALAAAAKPKTNLKLTADELVRLFSWLSSLTQEERDTRIACVSRLAPWGDEQWSEEAIWDDVLDKADGYRVPVRATNAWTTRLQLPLERLRKMQLRAIRRPGLSLSVNLNLEQGSLGSKTTRNSLPIEHRKDAV